MTNTVPSYWPETLPVKLAFIGEAPSDEELIAKTPLVGPSGRVFNAMLRNANIERDEVFITNVFDEKADDNDVEKAGWLKDEVRVQEAFARLNEELGRAQPNVIVPLGGTALWAFTGNKGITNFRGAVTPAEQIVPGAKLVPTLHPAAVLRSWHWMPIVVGDMVKAAAEAAAGPRIVYPKVQLLIEPSLDDIRRFVPECLASPKLSVDIETGWGQIRSIAFAPREDLAMSIPFIDLRRPSKSYWPTPGQEFAAWRLVQEMCESPVPKVGQNFMYDIIWLYMKHGIGVRNYRYDTRLRHKVLYPEQPADLATMSGSYTRIGSYKWRGGKYQKETKKDG